jgi:hypothetical protein
MDEAHALVFRGQSLGLQASEFETAYGGFDSAREENVLVRNVIPAKAGTHCERERITLRGKSPQK